MGTHTTRRSFALLAALGALGAAAGCNIVAPVYYAVHGPDKVDPVYDLAAATPTVILVDDPGSTVGQRRLRAEIADSATNILLQKGVSTNMIDPRPALALATERVDGKPMSITEIGKAVHADVVVYVLLTEFTTSADGASNLPSAAFRVKILDTQTGQRLWPEDVQGAPIQLRPKYGAGDFSSDPTAQSKAEQDLADRCGLAIAQLFYRHELPDSARR